MSTSLLLSLLNKILYYNESSLNLLTKHASKSFDLNAIGVSIKALINHNGMFIPLEKMVEPTVRIIIPLSTATYLVDNDKLTAFRKILFDGDITFGRELLEIFSNLHLDGVYAKTSPFNGMILSKLEQILIQIKQQLGLMTANSTNSVKEYLLYETEDLVTQHEMKDFCDSIDELSDRTNILQQQINLLSVAKP